MLMANNMLEQYITTREQLSKPLERKYQEGRYLHQLTITSLAIEDQMTYQRVAPLAQRVETVHFKDGFKKKSKEKGAFALNNNPQTFRMPGEEDIATSVQELDKDGNEADFSDDDGELDEMLATKAEEVSSQKALLSNDQKARAEKNKLKALALRKARLQAAPYSKEKDAGKPKRKEDKKLVDGGGGFFIEEEDEERAGDTVAESLPPPLMPPDQPDCEECGKPFATSHLLRTFDHPACDECKNMEKDGPHQLITKTDAKKEFLLKDTDFEKGERDEPFVPLKFVLRKNPHNPRWGDMKLFLRMREPCRCGALRRRSRQSTI